MFYTLICVTAPAKMTYSSDVIFVQDEEDGAGVAESPHSSRSNTPEPVPPSNTQEATFATPNLTVESVKVAVNIVSHNNYDLKMTATVIVEYCTLVEVDNLSTTKYMYILPSQTNITLLLYDCDDL